MGNICELSYFKIIQLDISAIISAITCDIIYIFNIKFSRLHLGSLIKFETKKKKTLNEENVSIGSMIGFTL